MLSVTNKPYMLSVVAPFSPSFPKIVFFPIAQKFNGSSGKLERLFFLITFSSFTLMTRRRNDVTKLFFPPISAGVEPSTLG